jgi:hypothetical protein
MALDNRSLGPFYFSRPPVTRRVFRPSIGDIVEMCEPWRRGKAVVLCTGFHKGIALGWWIRDINDDIVEDFAAPAWMKLLDASTDDISEWDNGAETEEGPRPTGEPEQRGTPAAGEEVL